MYPALPKRRKRAVQVAMLPFITLVTLGLVGSLREAWTESMLNWERKARATRGKEKAAS
jgi:hypothetical protein